MTITPPKPLRSAADLHRILEQDKVSMRSIAYDRRGRLALHPHTTGEITCRLDRYRYPDRLLRAAWMPWIVEGGCTETASLPSVAPVPGRTGSALSQPIGPAMSGPLVYPPSPFQGLDSPGESPVSPHGCEGPGSPANCLRNLIRSRTCAAVLATQPRSVRL
jgi:hypothetical protein